MITTIPCIMHLWPSNESYVENSSDFSDFCSKKMRRGRIEESTTTKIRMGMTKWLKLLLLLRFLANREEKRQFG